MYAPVKIASFESAIQWLFIIRYFLQVKKRAIRRRVFWLRTEFLYTIVEKQQKKDDFF